VVHAVCGLHPPARRAFGERHDATAHGPPVGPARASNHPDDAARELAHRFNNDLVLGMGVLELLRLHPETPLDIEPLPPDAIAGMDRITAGLSQLYQVARVETHDTPFGPALDLEQSAARASNVTA
jgi:hypothetical protein